MLFATNLNSSSPAERQSAERYEWLVYGRARDKKREAEAQRRWELKHPAPSPQLTEEQERERERQLWHRVKKDEAQSQ
mgnify:CR=1 FL=1